MTLRRRSAIGLQQVELFYRGKSRYAVNNLKSSGKNIFKQKKNTKIQHNTARNTLLVRYFFPFSLEFCPRRVAWRAFPFWCRRGKWKMLLKDPKVKTTSNPKGPDLHLLRRCRLGRFWGLIYTPSQEVRTGPLGKDQDPQGRCGCFLVWFYVKENLHPKHSFGVSWEIATFFESFLEKSPPACRCRCFEGLDCWPSFLGTVFVGFQWRILSLEHQTWLTCQCIELCVSWRFVVATPYALLYVTCPRLLSTLEQWTYCCSSKSVCYIFVVKCHQHFLKRNIENPRKIPENP